MVVLVFKNNEVILVRDDVFIGCNNIFFLQYIYSSMFLKTFYVVEVVIFLKKIQPNLVLI
jgi:hypothetical protein